MNRHDILGRRAFLRTAGLAATGGLLAGCSKAPTPEGADFRGRELNVFVYSGLDKIFQDHFAGPFEAKTGAQVVLHPGWWDSIGKLKASPKGQPAFDLVLTDATQGYPAIKSGMFRQIDLGKVPNLKALAPAVLDNWVVKERYGVTFPESAQTIVWDKRQVKDEPTGWGDLLRDDYRGKLALYDSFYMSLYTLACVKVASEGKAGTAHRAVADDLGGVIDFAKRERDRVRVWWPTGTKMIQDLLQGAFAVGNAHSVTALRTIKEKSDVLGFAAPEPDRAFVQLMWVIPSDTPNAELAEVAIDFLLSRDVQLALARRGTGTPHTEAAALAAAEDPLWAKTCPVTEEQFRAIRYYPYEEYFKDWDRLKTVWEQEILRKS